jgi:hypothetical protein
VAKGKMQAGRDENTLPPAVQQWVCDESMIHSANIFVATNKFVPRRWQHSPVVSPLIKINDKFRGYFCIKRS